MASLDQGDHKNNPIESRRSRIWDRPEHKFGLEDKFPIIVVKLRAHPSEGILEAFTDLRDLRENQPYNGWLACRHYEIIDSDLNFYCAEWCDEKYTLLMINIRMNQDGLIKLYNNHLKSLGLKDDGEPQPLFIGPEIFDQIVERVKKLPEYNERYGFTACQIFHLLLAGIVVYVIYEVLF